MKLNNPITINISGSEITLEDLDIVIFDHPNRKLVLAKLHPIARLLPLWRGSDYDEIGDYTQAQVEERILELLGENIQESLQALFNVEVLQNQDL